MIISGYQGIGKSTLAGKNKCIDLESGNFWVDGKRADDWYKPYCQIANHLSEQGYTVFVSSHEVVRRELEKSKEPVYVIFPAIDLKDEWIKKLEDRYNNTKLDKDYRALMNAKDRYKENITELMQGNLKFYEITRINYQLESIIDYLEYKSKNYKYLKDKRM